MCLKISSTRTPFVALIVGMYLEFSIRNGICDDSQLTYGSTKRVGSFSSPDSRHAHHSWKGWEDWVPPVSPYEREHEHKSTKNHYIPLSLNEQSKIRSRRNRTESVKASHSKSSTDKTEKTGKSHQQLLEEDIKGISRSAMNLATSAMDRFMTYWSSNSKPSKISRAIFLDNISDRQEGPNRGKPEREANRGVIDWLSRLIGVQGKTLGEFLREYQVHVLYDLAFTFFKWIFFLYAGLLIP